MGCFPQSTDTCGYWRRDCLSRTRVAGQFVCLSPFASFPQKCFCATDRRILVLIAFYYEILRLGGHLGNSLYKGTKMAPKNFILNSKQTTTLTYRYKYAVNDCLLGFLCFTLNRIRKVVIKR